MHFPSKCVFLAVICNLAHLLFDKDTIVISVGVAVSAISMINGYDELRKYILF